MGSPCGWADPLSDCQDGEEVGLTQRANRGGAGQGGQGQRHHPPVEHSFSGSVSIFVYDLMAKERFDIKSILWPEKPGTIDDELFPSQTSKIQTLGINGDFVATPEAALAWPHRQQLLFQVRGILLSFALIISFQSIFVSLWSERTLHVLSVQLIEHSMYTMGTSTTFFIRKALYDPTCTFRKLRDTTLT